MEKLSNYAGFLKKEELHVKPKIPYGSEVLKKIDREKRQKNVSPLLQEFMNRNK